MEAVLSAGFIPRAEAFVAALNCLDHPTDAALSQALPQTMKALKPYWGPAMDAGTMKFAKPSHREYAEKGYGLGLEGRLREFLDLKSPTETQIAETRSQMLELGTDVEIQIVLKALTRGRGLRSSEASIAMLETLEQMATSEWPKSLKRKMRGLSGLLNHKEDSIAVLAANNLGAWRVASKNELESLRKNLYSAAVRQALAIALATTSSSRYLDPLIELSSQDDIRTRYAAVAGVAQADLKTGCTVAAQLLSQDPAGCDPVPLVKSLLRRQKGGKLLSKELSNVTVHPTVMRRVTEFHRDSGLLSEALVNAFRPPTSSRSLSDELLAEDIQALTHDVEEFGDPARGETIFRRKGVACTSCHAIGSAGPTIGPNLVAVGAAAKTQYMVESILLPNKAIAEHYETRTFLLASGKIQTGIVEFRNEAKVVIRDSSELGKEVRIDVDDIDGEIPGKSLMPTGLADQLNSRDEFLDLVRFISVLGKSGAYANDESPVIRKWRVTQASDGTDLPDNDAVWVPAYSMVSGELPIEDFPPGERVLARGYVNVLVAGSVKLDMNATDGLCVWHNGNLVANPEAAITMDRGRHSLTFADRSEAAKHGFACRIAKPPTTP